MMNEINLATLAGGAVQERFNYELQKVLENISDANTEPKTKRKLTLTLILSPNEDRNDIGVDIQSKTTLAPIKSVGTRLYLNKDIKSKRITAQEANRGQMQNQMSLEEVDDTTEDENKNSKNNSIKLVEFASN